jgi:hypothetical protein
MDALKRRLIVISWLAANGDELFSARAHVPLIIERDAARKVALSMSLADVPPQNRVNLLGRRCSRRCERVSLVSSHHATAQEALWPFPVS